MLLVTREFHFDASHLLPGHSGKCARLHGHTYRVQVSIASESPLDTSASSDGMLIDFGDLKEIVNIAFLDNWDHRFLAEGSEWPALLGSGAHSAHIEVLGVRTTVENLTKVAARSIIEILKERYSRHPDTIRVEVTIHEGLNNSATYLEEFSV